MRKEYVTGVLRDLAGGSTDIEACALVSIDGLVMASMLPAGYQADRLAAMSAALLALGGQAAAEMNRGTLDQVLIKAADGHLLLTQASATSVLVVITHAGAQLGSTLLDVRRGAEALADIQ